MTPTPELISLAHQFHELGGTKGYLFNRYEFAIKPDGEVDCISSCDGENAYFRVYEDYPVSQLVPFLTADELWAWLWKRNYRLVQIGNVGNYGLQIPGDWEWLYVLDDDIYADNPHHALYKAAVWVAERMK